jgi:autotransporter adhesin
MKKSLMASTMIAILAISSQAFADCTGNPHDCTSATQTYVDQSIATETTRATNAESGLQSQITTNAGNITVLQKQAGDLQTQINNTNTTVNGLGQGLASTQTQVNANTAAINSLQTNSASHQEVMNSAAATLSAANANASTVVGAETQRAQGVEAGLQNQINNNAATASSMVQGENQRATTIEGMLQSQIAANASTAAGATAAETARAQTAESTLNAKVNTAQSTADKALGAAGAAQSTANQALTGAGVAIGIGIGNSIAINATDQRLDQTNANVANVAKQVSTNTSNIASLQQKSATHSEVTQAMGNAIEQANSFTMGQVAGESQRAQAAEASLSTAIGIETTRAEGAENNLQSQITTNAASAKSYTDQTAAKTLSAANRHADAVAAKDASIAYGAAVMTSNQYTNQVASKTLAGAKTYTDQQVGAESTRAQAAEQTNANAISNETQRAKTAEAGLQSQVTQNSGDIATLQQQSASHDEVAQAHAQSNVYTDQSSAATLQAANSYTDQSVANGVQAANNYTNQRFNQAESDISTLRQDMYGGVASAMAVAGLPQPMSNGHSMMSAAASTYHGATGYAIGVSTATGGWVVKGAVTGNSRGDFGAVVGAGYQF